jgi:hypothetical protein
MKELDKLVVEEDKDKDLLYMVMEGNEEKLDYNYY